MRYPPPSQCPMCGSSILETYDDSLPNFHIQEWVCKQGCRTHTFTDKGEITAYYFETTHKDKKYEACFYPRIPNGNVRSGDPNARFVLEYLPTNGTGWITLLALPFMPEITAHNFTQKLQTILLFH